MPASYWEQLRQEVFSRQKVLAEIYENFGRQSLYQYAQGWSCGVSLEPQLKAALVFLLSKNYGEVLAQQVIGELEQFPLVSTIDHHGLIGHPFFLNSNLIFSLKTDRKFLLCLSTSGISLNNSSWPASFVFHNEAGRLDRINLFSDPIKTQTVWSAQARGPKEEKAVARKVSAVRLTLDEKERLQELSQELWSQPWAAGENFSRQAGSWSRILWRKYFPQGPELIYLPLEELTAELMSRVVIPQADHVLHQLFFTPSGWQLVEKYFQGSLGAFTSTHKGSFLFWGINNKGRRVHLRLEGQALVGQDFYLPLEPDKVTAMLGRRLLYPSTLVCFLTVSLYYGLTCLGGFNQVNWLTQIKERFVKLLREWKQDKLSQVVEKRFTENFAEAGLAFAKLNQQPVQPAGLDLYFAPGQDWYNIYHRLARDLTLQESIDSLLPDIYRIVVPVEQRQSQLLEVKGVPAMINGKNIPVL